MDNSFLETLSWPLNIHSVSIGHQLNGLGYYSPGDVSRDDWIKSCGSSFASCIHFTRCLCASKVSVLLLFGFTPGDWLIPMGRFAVIFQDSESCQET